MIKTLPPLRTCGFFFRAALNRMGFTCVRAETTHATRQTNMQYLRGRLREPAYYLSWIFEHFAKCGKPLNTTDHKPAKPCTFFRGGAGPACPSARRCWARQAAEGLKGAEMLEAAAACHQKLG